MPLLALTVFLLAAVSLPTSACTTGFELSENSRLGVATFKTTSHHGWSAANSLNASGIDKCLYDSGRRTRSTGKERDSESNLDFFLSRYYSSAQGRFTSPDEWAGGIVDAFTGGQVGQPGPLPYADFTDPQTLNKYVYVRNNPLRYVDPDGHCIWDICIGEGIAVYAAAGATLAVGGYLATPQGQAQAREFVSSVADAIGSGIGFLAEKVNPYDVGPYNELKGRSTPGDGLDIHHVPQSKPAEQIIEGYDPRTGPAIAVPKEEHRTIPTERGDGKRNPRDQLAKDAKDLRNKTKAPNSKIKEVIDRAKEKYPDLRRQPGTPKVSPKKVDSNTK